MADKNNGNYVAMMVQSLQKKVKLLNKIIEKNEEQGVLFHRMQRADEQLEACILAKGKLIDEIETLDKGFEKLYNRVKEEFECDKKRYADEIIKMQELIKEITEKGAKIEAQEKRNHTLATNYFSNTQAKIGQVRNTSRVANLYRQNMRGTAYVESQFWDKKK
ncbi:MAG: flagellar protein FliT [Eubacterium sp.]|nr:flagellar protein FliT [Eubacterium sp.]